MSGLAKRAAAAFAQDPLWTEPTWTALHVETFVADAVGTDAAVFCVGLVVMGVCIAAAYGASKMSVRFKID